MISIIIPTMLLCPIDTFEYSIFEMQKSKFVGEIIIINNSKLDIMDKLNISNKKLFIINEYENIGVNPAWNEGVSVARFDKYLLFNDDVLCNKNIYESCELVLKQRKDVGLVTVNTISAEINTYHEIENIRSDVVSLDIPNFGRVGWFMCGRISQWIDIPVELKIYYGDDFIYEQIRRQNLLNVILTENTIGHHGSVTTDLLGTVNGMCKEGSEYRNLI